LRTGGGRGGEGEWCGRAGGRAPALKPIQKLPCGSCRHMLCSRLAEARFCQHSDSHDVSNPHRTADGDAELRRCAVSLHLKDFWAEAWNFLMIERLDASRAVHHAMRNGRSSTGVHSSCHDGLFRRQCLCHLSARADQKCGFGLDRTSQDYGDACNDVDRPVPEHGSESRTCDIMQSTPFAFGIEGTAGLLQRVSSHG
jgi:hypothetical protein